MPTRLPAALGSSKALLTAMIACALFAGTPPAASAQPKRLLSPTASRVLLLDASGNTLFERDSDEAHPPASLVKLMTLYLAYEDLEAGQVGWEEPVTVSANAAGTPRFRMGLRAGETVAFGVLLQAVAIASANDAATAVAEHLGRSEESFVTRMNAKARGLGLAATHFANAHGLPDPGQRSTAHDLALLTGRLLHDHPAARVVLGGQSFLYRGRVYTRRIPLFQNPGGVEALKTGFTNEAGYNLAVVAWHGGREFLIIVLGAHSRALSYLDARKVLRYGFGEGGLEDDPPKIALKPSSKTARSARAGKRPPVQQARR
jgi:D-alanyl-D-alanine carboxypeptidase